MTQFEGFDSPLPPNTRIVGRVAQRSTASLVNNSRHWDRRHLVRPVRCQRTPRRVRFSSVPPNRNGTQVGGHGAPMGSSRFLPACLPGGSLKRADSDSGSTLRSHCSSRGSIPRQSTTAICGYGSNGKRLAFQACDASSSLATRSTVRFHRPISEADFRGRVHRSPSDRVPMVGALWVQYSSSHSRRSWQLD